MYCNKCGKPVYDDDRFCRYCGNELKWVTEKETAGEEESPAPSKNAEPRVEADAPRRISTDEFVWDVHELFDRPVRKPGEVYVDWAAGTVIEKGQPEEEPVAAPPKEAADGISVEAHKEPVPAEEVSIEAHEETAPAEDVPVTMDDIQKDIEKSNADLKRATAQIEKFYTFNRKNEEFQKLLDKEYERIHGGVPADTAQIYLEFERLTNPDFEEEIPQDAEEEPQEQQSFEGGQFDPVEHLKQAAIARESEPTGAEILDNEAIIHKFDTMELGKTESVENEEKSPFETVILDELFGTVVERSDSADMAAQEPKESSAGAAQELKPAAAVSEDLREDVAGDVAKDPTGDLATDVTEGLDLAGDVTEGLDLAAAATNDTKEDFAPPQHPSTPTDEVSEESDEYIYEEERGGVLRVFLVIIVVLLICVLWIAGIKYFIPESNVAKFIDEKILYPVETIFTDETEQTQQEPAEEAAAQTEPEEVKAMSMSETIESQLGINKNIQAVAYDDTLLYKAEADYGKQDLNESVALTERYTEAEEYNAQASKIAGALIAFDSGWIDYVNDKDKSVFSLLQPKSRAYNLCSAYKKAGLVKKQFEELKIGEIRAGAEGFYIWANERISTTENGKTGDETFKWIYYLEQNGENMQIVDYMRNKS